MKTDQSLSIVVIAGNEQDMIGDCLKSCRFADEIILVAANSTDDTKKIAKNTIPNIKIIETFDEYNKNFSKWRNLGYKAVKSPWILYIDADERITSDLQQEIISKISSSHPQNYYVIPRANFFLGKRVHYGNSYPDYVKRLYNMAFFKGYRGYLHEEPIITGNFGYLKNDLTHYTHRRLDTMLQKSLAWTDMEARALYENNHPPVVWWRILRMMSTKLWQRLVIEKMWKDGTVGWISAIFEAFDTFIIYTRLWELQQPKLK